jgi:hypothetical protein
MNGESAIIVSSIIGALHLMQRPTGAAMAFAVTVLAALATAETAAAFTTGVVLLLGAPHCATMHALAENTAIDASLFLMIEAADVGGGGGCCCCCCCAKKYACKLPPASSAWLVV